MVKHADPLLERYEQISSDQHALLAEIQKSRMAGYNQPQRVIGSFAGAGKGLVSPFRSLGHFLKAVRECPAGNFNGHNDMKSWIGTVNKTLPTGMSETTGADGGYLVPPEYANQILMRTYDNDLLSRTTMFPLTNSNMLKVPAINETSRADGSRFGGVQGYWRSEAGDLTLSKPSLATVDLTVDSLTVAVRVTQELLDDAGPALETFVNLVAPAELAFKVGDAIVNGDGVTKPLGLMKSASKVAQAKETGQAAATINAANILKMWSRLHPSCENNAVWLHDKSITPQLGQMTIGTAGAQMVVYQPKGGLSEHPFATLMGQPLLPVEFCQQVGTEGDIILTDLATILSAVKGGLQAASSMHVYFLSNEMAYRFVLRVDARSWWFNPLTPKSGGPTLSNIVTLATR